LVVLKNGYSASFRHNPQKCDFLVFRIPLKFPFFIIS
jgi:hypothetical protein